MYIIFTRQTNGNGWNEAEFSEDACTIVKKYAELVEHIGKQNLRLAKDIPVDEVAVKVKFHVEGEGIFGQSFSDEDV